MARKKGLFPNGLSIGRPKQLNLKPKFIEKIWNFAFIVVKSSNVSKKEEIFLFQTVGQRVSVIHSSLPAVWFKFPDKLPNSRWTMMLQLCLSFTSLNVASSGINTRFWLVFSIFRDLILFVWNELQKKCSFLTKRLTLIEKSGLNTFQQLRM